jgi:hypothetical protein
VQGLEKLSARRIWAPWDLVQTRPTPQSNSIDPIGWTCGREIRVPLQGIANLHSVAAIKEIKSGVRRRPPRRSSCEQLPTVFVLPTGTW